MSRRPRRIPRLWSVALVLGLALICLGAREAVVTTVDGQRFQGVWINQTDERVVLGIAGVRTAIDRDRIADIEFLEPVMDEYLRRLSALDPADLDARYQLAYDMFERRAYAIALDELEALAQDAPDSERVQRLLTVVQQRLKLEAAAREDPAPPPSDPSAGVPETATPAAPEPDPDARRDPRLSFEQINRIKVYELDLDNQPRVAVPRQAIADLFDAYAGDPRLPRGREERAAFFQQPGYEHLRLLFELQAREFYDRVRVLDEPEALLGYRTTLHRQYVLNYCGTANCHGGVDAPRPRISRRQPASEPTAYTNFFRLNAYASPAGRMIDRDLPQRSLLLQYGLPQDEAAVPHPEVRGWRPMFTGEADDRFEAYAELIGRLYQPRPDYGIPPEAAGIEPSQPVGPQQPPAPGSPPPAGSSPESPPESQPGSSRGQSPPPGPGSAQAPGS